MRWHAPYRLRRERKYGAHCCTGAWHWDLSGAATVDSSIVSFAMEFPRIVGELHVFVETAADTPKEVDIWVNGTKALQNPTNSFRGVKTVSTLATNSAVITIARPVGRPSSLLLANVFCFPVIC